MRNAPRLGLTAVTSGCLFLTALVVTAPAQARPAVAIETPRAEELPGLETGIVEVADRAIEATVGIRVGGNLGSGVLVSERGHILTAGHVIEAPDRRVTVTLSDGREVQGRTMGVNQWIDSGMVLLEDEGPWPYLEMGTVEDVESGDWVLAVGHPGGVEESRPPVVRLGRVAEADARVIRSDCTIVSGDSGGPLIDLDGNVIGIHTSLRPVLVANDHLPVDTYRRTWQELTSGLSWGRWRGGGRAILGVQGESARNGALIVGVRDGYAADRAGLTAGDLITDFDGMPLDGGLPELEQLVSERQVGDLVELRVLRDGDFVTLEADLDAYRGPAPVRIVPTPRDVYRRSKYDRAFLREFENVADVGRSATVAVRSNGRTVALGTVVDAGGWIVTKASELDDDVSVRAKGRNRDARVVAVDEKYDLALLHVDDLDLGPAPFASDGIRPGQWLVTPDASGGLPAAVGVLSVPPREVPTRLGYLGVIVQTRGGDAFVVEVRPDSGAEDAGLEGGDILFSFNSEDVSGSEEFTSLVQQQRPASTIRLGVWRDEDRDGTVDPGESFDVDVTLGEHPYEESQAVAQQDQQAGPLSTVRSGFPLAIQHDSVLRPEECGGPLLDSRGRVVGVNLARAGRSASFAIPTKQLLEVVESLKERAAN